MTLDRYAVIGQPVNQSKSPQIHQAFAASLGESLDYGRIEVAPENLAAKLSALHAEGYRGLNVTAPHKRAVRALCTRVSVRAELAGAVNTLVREADGWSGDNSDGEGFIRDLRDNLGVALRGKRVVLLGAGGAARGLLKPILDEQPAEFVLSNRNPWKPEELALEFKPHGTIRPCTHAALKGDTFDVVIHATSAGHQGQVPRLPPGLFAPGAVAYDLSYAKVHGPFADWARTQGAARVLDGMGMLVEQAAVSYALWRGRRPATAPVLAQLRAAT